MKKYLTIILWIAGAIIGLIVIYAAVLLINYLTAS